VLLLNNNNNNRIQIGNNNTKPFDHLFCGHPIFKQSK
jgi:hypothetical protein